MIAIYRFLPLSIQHWRSRIYLYGQLLQRNLWSAEKKANARQGTATFQLCSAVLASLLLMVGLLLLWPTSVLAQSTQPTEKLMSSGSLTVPTFWYVLAAAISLLAPAGFVLIGVAGLDPQHAWDAALGGMAAVGLAVFGYWAIGFALHFGGVGLVYTLPELKNMVWEWSPFSSNWGVG